LCDALLQPRVLPGGSVASSTRCPRPPSARSSRPRASRSRAPRRGCATKEGLLVVGIDLAGQEKGYPAEDHRKAYQIAHEAFLGKTVHAGEDYGPESIFQAIGDLHADRIGHGTWLFDDTKITSPRIRDRNRYVENLSEFIADKRITIEVCLTSNQQTVPELAADLQAHPFAEMRRRRLSTTFCTDNRLVSDTNVSHEICRAVEAFALTPQEVRDILIYGFKRSFFPGTYLEKRQLRASGDQLREPAAGRRRTRALRAFPYVVIPQR
jgi:adenosine deaminase